MRVDAGSRREWLV